MTGNKSYEEHAKHFTEMFNHLKSANQHLDNATIMDTIKNKIMIVQEWENITYNLNIKNIHDTKTVKDFEIWVIKFYEENPTREVSYFEFNQPTYDLFEHDKDEDEDDEDYYYNSQGLEDYLRNGGEGGNENDEDYYYNSQGLEDYLRNGGEGGNEDNVDYTAHTNNPRRLSPPEIPDGW